MIAFVYDILFLLPFTAALSLFLKPYFWPEYESGTVLFAGIACTVVLLLLRHLKTHGRIWLAGTLAAAGLSILLLQPASDRPDFLLEHLWILHLFLLTILSFLLHLLQESCRPVRLLIAAGSCIALAICLFWDHPVEKASVGLILFYLIVTLANENQRRSVKEGDTDPKKHLVFVSPFFLLLFTGVFLLKAPDTPYGWGFVSSIAGHIKDGIHILEETFFSQGSWDSASPHIGFSDRGEFADSLTRSDYTAMTIDLRTGTDPQLYLAGKRFDTFDGQHWEKQDQSTADLQGFDTLETLSAVLDYENILYPEDLMQRASVNVSYNGLRSACIFTLPKLIPGHGVKGMDPMRTGGDLEAAGGKRARQDYDLVYYRLNRENDAFLELLNTPHTVTEQSWNNAREQCGLEDPSSYTYEEYLAYHEALSDQYLSEITLSPQLQARMDAVMDGADTDYEKLLRIEAMLRGFRYTDQPGALPKTIPDASAFLDYFILEKQEGYCTYYATAFVLLARSCGIPARYIQGFRVPTGMASHTKAEVLSSFAHAWPEAYLEGIGWFGFEPTAGLLRGVRWTTTEERQAAAAERGTTVSDNYAGDRPSSSASENRISSEEGEETPGFILRWYHIVLPLGAGLLLAALLFGLDRLIHRIRYRRMNTREKALWLCRRNLDLLKRMKMSRRESETIEEFAARAGERFEEEELVFCNIYEELLYGDPDPSEEILDTLSDNLALLRRHRWKKEK
ncbi:MAG: hypothetical protein J6N53_01275 [Lachnospiraceae bacterium]|nr:hypothetical protein [Lachnospiraceae bacterium]